jgi:hypothetical protein
VKRQQEDMGGHYFICSDILIWDSLTKSCTYFYGVVHWVGKSQIVTVLFPYIPVLLFSFQHHFIPMSMPLALPCDYFLLMSTKKFSKCLFALKLALKFILTFTLNLLIQ